MAILSFPKFGLNLPTFSIEKQAFLSVLGKYSIYMLMLSWLFYHFVEHVQHKQARFLSSQILFFTTPTANNMNCHPSLLPEVPEIFGHQISRTRKAGANKIVPDLIFVCLFDLILYVHSTIFQLCGTVFLG